MRSLSDTSTRGKQYVRSPRPLLPPFKKGYVFGSVGLFVCLFVNNITQKVMNGLG